MEAVKERLARGYSQSAPRYDALAGHLYLTGIRRLLPRVRVGPLASILDVGCGTGVNLLEAARWFAPAGKLCGIDISPGMVAVAQSKAGLLGVPAQFRVGDAEKLPYPDAEFDLVICNSVLHWFKDRGAALREMRRVVKPGGQVLIICAAAPGFCEWFAFIDQVRQLAGMTQDPTLTPDLPAAAEVAGLMQAAGLAVEHLANPVQLQQITDYEGFIRLMSTVAPLWTADLTPEAQTLLEQLSARLMRTAFPVSFPNTWAAIEAVGARIG
ncbi:MAG TPA: class I SAM-dependent methyltransferase [Symbiobacteriaceae bacterium]|nr:class I SAM-dependent methyltransferase [Symbiobacteriaceae bacterium]